jgi:nitrite reductase (NADH) large subunit
MERLVVIGNGMAGARTVEEILERGGRERFVITMFGEEPYGNYNRILLSNVLSGAEDEANIFLNSLPWYVENGIDLRVGVRVERIDQYARTLRAADGSVTPYDKLVIATGSRPYVPPIEGMHHPRRGYHELATGCSRTGQPPLAVYAVRVDEAGDLVVNVPPAGR